MTAYTILLKPVYSRPAPTLPSGITLPFPVTIMASAQNISDAVDAIEKYSPHLVFLDIQMGEQTGFDVLNYFQIAISKLFLLPLTTNMAYKL